MYKYEKSEYFCLKKKYIKSDFAYILFELLIKRIWHIHKQKKYYDSYLLQEKINHFYKCIAETYQEDQLHYYILQASAKLSIPYFLEYWRELWWL